MSDTRRGVVVRPYEGDYDFEHRKWSLSIDTTPELPLHSSGVQIISWVDDAPGLTAAKALRLDVQVLPDIIHGFILQAASKPEVVQIGEEA